MKTHRKNKTSRKRRSKTRSRRTVGRRENKMRFEPFRTRVFFSFQSLSQIREQISCEYATMYSQLHKHLVATREPERKDTRAERSTPELTRGRRESWRKHTRAEDGTRELTTVYESCLMGTTGTQLGQSY